MGTETIREYYGLSTELWKFTKGRLEGLENTDAFWDETFRLANGMAERHAGTGLGRYAGQMVRATLLELERLCREGGGNA